MRSVIKMIEPKITVSFNVGKSLTGKELIALRYGHNLSDLAGSIRKKVSFWAIDESGSVGRTEKSVGKAITYSAVTQLSIVDYESLFDGIPKSIDKNGHTEIHYIDLKMNDPDNLYKVVDRIADSPFLVISLPIEKTDVDKRRRWYKPKNGMYVLSAISKLVEAIEVVDESDTIVVTFDQTSDMTDELLEVLWTDRTIIRMDRSYLVQLLQISDIAASVTGNAINNPDELNNELFWKLCRINVNLSDRAFMTSAANVSDTDMRTISRNYKKSTSKGTKSAHGLMTIATDNRRKMCFWHKKPRSRRFMR